MFRGSIVALVTPFTRKFEVDEKAFRHLVEWQIQEKTDGIVLSGATGEGSVLSEEEQLRLLKIALEIAGGKIPIIARTGCNNTQRSVEMTRKAKELGAAGALATTPYYVRPSAEGCYAHFREMAKVGLPLIFYHHPGRTGVKLNVKGIAKICSLPEVVAIKESSGDIELMAEVARTIDKPILAGDDPLALPIISIGGVGIISVINNVIPRAWKQAIDAATSGDFQKAKALFDRYAPLCRALFLETSPQGVKYAVSLLGKCEPVLRLPLLEPQEETKEQIRKALLELSLPLHTSTEKRGALSA